ncbi:MAG: hypothetical protein EAZ57_06330 [Cytophagales bacterium]|nr:MAG: hypothetical protein EAZ67_07495 [Cytophagales bacterium]TAF60642.1 MAG: hypothetical protein EAZ57_06330 [Cytophagales bacterium]
MYAHTDRAAAEPESHKNMISPAITGLKALMHNSDQVKYLLSIQEAASQGKYLYNSHVKSSADLEEFNVDNKDLTEIELKDLSLAAGKVNLSAFSSEEPKTMHEVYESLGKRGVQELDDLDSAAVTFEPPPVKKLFK